MDQDMKRIAILADPVDNQSAGVHTFTREMIRALLRNDRHNRYFLFRRRRSPQFEGARSIPIPQLRWTLLFPAFRLFVLFGRIARRLKVDIVVEPAHFGPFFMPRRVKRVTVIHDMTPLKFPEHHRFHSQLLQSIFMKRILKNANLIITNSENSRQDIVRLFPFTEPKVESIYLGYDERFKPTIQPEVLAKYNINAPYFLFVSTIEPRKNLSLLLKSYLRFRMNNNTRSLLVIVGGKGWKCRKTFSELDKHPFRNDIILPGYVPEEELPALYSQALAFVYPSFYEGFGLPVLEAMACGAPCLVSNVSSLPEVAGNATLMFNPFDASDLTDQMDRVAWDPSLRAELSAGGLKQASNFSWDRFATEFMNALCRHKLL
jgi:glycosyltransferase involved in cell wall biosynthesis